MQERSLILIDGPPGSGSTRLSRFMKERLLEEKISIDHISTGERLRAIGKGVLDSAFSQAVADHIANFGLDVPIDDSLMLAIVDEAFDEHKKQQILILDGFPRYEPQVDDLATLTESHDRTLRGVIVTRTDWQTSLERMIARGEKNPERAISRDAAIDRLADRMSSFPAVIDALEQMNVPIRYVDTDGPKSLTDRLGLQAMRSFYTPGSLSHIKNAP
jgi:adenylate kinase